MSHSPFATCENCGGMHRTENCRTRKSVSKFIAVATKNGEAVKAYLYDHTRFVGHSTDGDRSLFILETRADTEDRAQYLAQYQADRLSSGMHAAKVFDTYEAADTHLVDTFGKGAVRL